MIDGIASAPPTPNTLITEDWADKNPKFYISCIIGEDFMIN
jgi:hypothetical protein